MRISRFSRRFHDPWGNKNGNRCGSPIRGQYVVGKSQLKYENNLGNVNSCYNRVDVTMALEATGLSRYVFTTQASPERLRK